MWIVVVVVVSVLALLAFGKAATKNEKARWEQQKADDIAASIERRLAGERALERAAELSDAKPLVDPPTSLEGLKREVKTVLHDFDSLGSFQDVTEWDTEAGLLVDRLQDAFREVDLFRERAEAAMAEPGADWARVQKTRAADGAACAAVNELTEHFDRLTENIDLTPNSKQDQARLIKDLRLEKRELTAQKKEARASATEVRQEARSLSVNAGAGDWTKYDRRRTAEYRRQLRRAAESGLRPHENAIAAIDRQMLALDRRINWLARFGDEDAA